MSFLFKARRGRSNALINNSNNGDGQNVQQQQSSVERSHSQQKHHTHHDKGTESPTTSSQPIEQDDLTKMYEEMYEKQDQIHSIELEEEQNAVKQKFIKYRNPLYEGEKDDENEYEEEPDEEELFYKRQQEEEERRRNRKLRRMNVVDIEHVPIKLQVNERKFASVGQLLDSGNKWSSKVAAFTKSNKYDADSMLQESTREAMLSSSIDAPLDELFEDAQYSLAGVLVWHIQGMVPVLVDEDDWGTFYSGDCYVVMKTFDAQDEEERLRIIFSWMGEDSNWQKRAICSFLVQELAAKLTSGMKRLRMEKQYEEGAEFRDVFGKGAHLRYEKGSFSDETLTPCPKPAGASPTSVLTFSWRNNNTHSTTTALKPVIIRVPWSKRFSAEQYAEQNKSSAFIVVAPEKIYVWIGSECLQPLQIKIIDVATMILYEEHKAEGQLVIVSQGEETEDFLKHLPAESSVPQFSDDHLNNDTLVYRVGLNEETKEIDITHVPDFQLDRDSFETNFCYLIETQYDLYGWMGADSLPLERRYLKRFLSNLSSDSFNTVSFFDGNEPVLMKERFTGYYVTETREAFEQKRRLLSNISKRKLTVDTESYFDEYNVLDREAEKQKKIIDELDDGSGTVQVWRVIDNDLAEPVLDDEIGNFHTGECYLILYEFNRADVLYGEDEEEGDEEEEEEDDEDYDDDDKDYKDYDYESQESDDEEEDHGELVTKSADVKNKRIAYLTRRILYCWEGAESDKKVAARILKENFNGYATDAINPAIVLTLYEGKESKHFMRVFEHIMTIHRGRSTDKRESYDGALYRVYCKIDPEDDSTYNSKAVEVPRRKSSLNSNDIFVLVASKNAYVWIGTYASATNKKVAFKLAQALITGNQRVLAIDEDQEPEEFWEDLGQVSITDKYPMDKINYEKGNVYECTITSENKFRVMDIGKVGENILQPDLTDCHYPLIFDFGTTMFIWYPLAKPDPTVQYLTRHAVYQLTEPDEEEKEDGEEKEEKPLPNFHEVCVAGVDTVKVFEEYRGTESAEFKMVFPMWRAYHIFVDQYDLEKQKDEQARRAAIIQALPFVEIMREKHAYLMQEDEYVNIHNAVELIKIGVGAKTNFDVIINELCKLDIYDFNNDLDQCNLLASDLFKFCLTGIKKKK